MSMVLQVHMLYVNEVDNEGYTYVIKYPIYMYIYQ